MKSALTDASCGSSARLRVSVLVAALSCFIHPAAYAYADVGPAGVSSNGALQSFDIGSQPLASALREFARQSRQELLFSPEIAAGKVSQGVRGNLAPLDALATLLRNTNVSFSVTPNGAILLRNIAGASASADYSQAWINTPASQEAGQIGAGTGENAQSPSRRRVDRGNPPVTSSGVTELDTIVVSRPFTDANVDIVRTENDVQPYYIFKGQEIADSNAGNLEEFLRQKLTMNSASYTNSQSPASGRGNAGEVNLRGLGLNQTLILINGRRTAGATSGSGAIVSQQFDLNAFAPAMIDRIEVLPSSASAIYGGSAVGGVLNVILKRDFTGGDFRFTYDTPLDTTAPTRSLTGGYGWSLEDGRTNIAFSASYRDDETLTREDRPELWRRGLQLVLERSPALLYSSNSPFYTGATTNIASLNGNPLVFDDGTPLGSSLTYVPTRTSHDTSAAQLQAGLLANAGLQNTTSPRTRSEYGGLLSGFSATGKAASATGSIRRKMTDQLELIGEVFYNRNESTFTSANDHVFAQLPANSLSNPFQQDIRLAIPMTVDFSRINERSSLRAVAGFVLDLPHEWRAQGDYTWNRNEINFSNGPRADSAALTAAYNNGMLNPLVDTVAYPLDMEEYRTVNSYAASKSTLADIGFRVSGPLGNLPAGQPNLTIGLGHREEKQPWAYFNNPGSLQTYLPQSQSVSSAYAELLLPLVAPSNAIPAVRLLELQLASRVEDYRVKSGTARRVTYPPDYAVDPNEVLQHEKINYSALNTTIGLRYKPVDALTLRASYATAFLPPGFSDFLPGVFDPTNPARGNDPRRGNESFAAPYIFGGNPDLKPMDAKTWNVGVLIEPLLWEGVRLGLEWFRIERSNLIFSPNIIQILANEELYSNRVERAAPQPGDPYGVGPITFIDLTVLNAREVSTEGFDISLGYRKDSERYGIFSVDVLGTVIDSFTRRLSVDSAENEIVGHVPDGGPLKLRANMTLGWERGPWSLGWTVLYYGPYDQYDSPLYITAQGSTVVPRQVYHNLLAGYRFASDNETSDFRRLLSGATLTLGIRNLFNTVPPFDVTGPQYFSPFGDYRLRSVQLSAAVRF